MDFIQLPFFYDIRSIFKTKNPKKEKEDCIDRSVIFFIKTLKTDYFFVELKIMFEVSLGIIEVFLLGVEKMKERTLQILRYLTLPCLFSCLSLVADEQEEGSQSSTSKKPMMTFCQTYDMLKTKDVTPYAGPAVDGGVDAYIKASYILWHASEQGLGYAMYGIADPTTSVTTNYAQSQGRVIAPKFKTSSGFKVGLGLDFAYDGWDLGLNYTWLHTHATSSISALASGDGDSDDAAIQGLLLPTHATAFATSTVGSVESIVAGKPASGLVQNSLNSASSSWRLHFNVLDLELGRDFFISSKLLVRPHYGLKGTWQKQNNNLQYVAQGELVSVVVSGLVTTSGGTVVTVPDTATETISVDSAVETYQIASRQSSWGLGPRAGMNLSWLVTRNFSFFTDTAVSLLWGQFKDTRFDVASAVDTTKGTVIFSNYNPINVRSRVHQVNAVVEMQLGLRYDYWFSNDEYRFRAEAGWENQLWFNQQHFAFTESAGSANLSLQGFTLTFQFDF